MQERLRALRHRRFAISRATRILAITRCPGALSQIGRVIGALAPGDPLSTVAALAERRRTRRSRSSPVTSGAVATARSAAGGKNLEILGADVAGQCLRRGLVDEILVYVLPVLLGDGIRFSSPGLARIDLEPVSSTRSGAVTILRFRVRK